MPKSLPEPQANTGIIAGLHAVRTALAHGVGQVHTLWHDSSRNNRRTMEVLKQATHLRVPVFEVDKITLDRITSGANHQGVAAQASIPAAQSELALNGLMDSLAEPPFILILDGIQDPHNLGACLRTAEAAGVHAIIAARDRSVGLTPSVCKVASGAASRIPYIQVTNLVRTIKVLQQRGVWLVGAALDAPVSLYQSDLQGPLAIVLGGESDGLRRLTRDNCDLLVNLPMCGVIESLNVSVAAGILLYEALRQRKLSTSPHVDTRALTDIPINKINGK